MPHTPLSYLRPRDFPKIGDEEFAFDSFDEDTEDEIKDEDIAEEDEESEPLLRN